MSEHKSSRFRDLGTAGGPLALKGLSLRPRGTVVDPKTDAVTYVGRLAEATGKSLLAQVEELKAERESGFVLVSLSPEDIAVTEFANRHSVGLTIGDPQFDALKQSIKTNGQDTPIRIRPSAAGAAKPYDLVEGHRRLAAIQLINRETEGGFQILARIDGKCVEAVELVKKMYRENAERADLSPVETGSMFAMWLRAGVCKTQRDVAAFTSLDESTVSQYLALAELPPEVLSAFSDLRQISLRWSKGLAKACKDHLPETIARARKIAKQTPRPEAEAVYQMLATGLPFAARKAKRGSKKSDMVYVDDKVLFKIALKDKHLTFSRWQVEPELVPALYDDVKAFFDEWLKNHAKAKS